MAAWEKNELTRIAGADDLHISPFRDNGVTYGTPAWIWCVVVGEALYVRAYNGQNSRRYRAALRQKAGRIAVAGITKEVTFERVDGAVNDLIDEAYQAKYKNSPYPQPPYLQLTIGARARSATVKIDPREMKGTKNEFESSALGGDT